MHKNITPEEERRLVHHAQATPEGVRALYHAYHTRIFAYVVHNVGRKLDAEDIVSETFLRMVRSLQEFEYRGAGSFSAWLFQIARNEMRRYGKNNAKMGDMLHLDDVPTISSDLLPPEFQVQRKEQFLELRNAIQMLSQRRQEIIELRFFGGLRNKEIADILEVDERTVASHLCRGIDDLRLYYENNTRVKGSQNVDES